MKKNKKIILSLVLIGMITAGFVAISQHRQPDLIQTKDISSTQAIGGTPVGQDSGAQTQPEKKQAPLAHTQTQPQDRHEPLTAPDSTPNSPDTPTVSKEYEYRALGPTPNDPYAASAWLLQKTGTVNAWEHTTGSQVVVAVIDTGFALQHEDLVNSWYHNPGETGVGTDGKDRATNGIDDDNNGYIDDWRGWNFYGRYQPTDNPCSQDGMGTYIANNNPQAGQSGDDILYQEDRDCFGVDPGDPHAAVSHGTSAAGLTGATTNNGLGIATANWHTKIMPLQVLGDDGSGWTSKIVAAVRYAVDNGAQVINMSLGGPELDPNLQEAIQYAYQHNVVVVAAAGNCGTGNEAGCMPSKPGQMMYPALYPHVIAVGATDQNDNRAGFSSYGRGLDVVAPGYGTLVSPTINTTTSPYNYTTSYAGGLAGTSFASPVVASIASLIRSQRPASTVDDIVALINASARKPSGMNGALYTPQYGHGIIDANTASAVASTLSTSSAQPIYSQAGTHRTEHTFLRGDMVSSGCTAAYNSYCTIRFTEPATGFERFLPYQATNATGEASWRWNTDALDYGEWWGRAQSGTYVSANDYLLFSK